VCKGAWRIIGTQKGSYQDIFNDGLKISGNESLQKMFSNKTSKTCYSNKRYETNLDGR
jgi:hypothetical protein